MDLPSVSKPSVVSRVGSPDVAHTRLARFASRRCTHRIDSHRDILRVRALALRVSPCDSVRRATDTSRVQRPTSLGSHAPSTSSARPSSPGRCGRTLVLPLCRTSRSDRRDALSRLRDGALESAACRTAFLAQRRPRRDSTVAHHSCATASIQLVWDKTLGWTLVSHTASSTGAIAPTNYSEARSVASS